MDKLWLTLLLSTLFLYPSQLLAQDKQPLRWGIDEAGGVPFFFSAPDDPDVRIGFEKDLIDSLATELKRPINRVHKDFKNLIPSLDRGDVDFAMNGIEITPKNLQDARFTRPYYIYQLQLIVRIGEDRFTTLKECHEKGLTVGILDGSAHAKKVLEDHKFDQSQIKPYEDQDPTFDVLMNKQIDAVLIDLPIATYYVVADDQIEHRKKKYTGRFQVAGPPMAECYYGIAVKKNDEALAKDLDEALGRIIESGELKRILTKWHIWSPDQYRLYRPVDVGEASSLSLGFFQYFGLLLKGAGTTVLITIASMALAVMLGLPIAMTRLYAPLPLRWLAIGYVEFFRGIPVLLLLYFLYYGLPNIHQDMRLDPYVVAIVGFGLNYAAYEAEIYRNGIQSIPLGQWEASASLGMSSFLTFRRIIFPQSIRVILPPMTNDFIALFKDTSIVSVIAVVELTKEYQILTNSYRGYLEIGLTTAALYLVMSVPLGYLSRHLEKRWGAK